MPKSKQYLVDLISVNFCQEIFALVVLQPTIAKFGVLLRSVNEENCEDVWTTPREVFAPLLPRSQHRVKKCFPQLQHEVSENQISPK